MLYATFLIDTESTTCIFGSFKVTESFCVKRVNGPNWIVSNVSIVPNWRIWYNSIWSIDLYYTKRFGHIDAFSTTQFGTIDASSAHQFGLVDTFNTITSTRIWPFGLFLDHFEGKFGNFKHILIFRGIKFTRYEFSCHHCWIPAQKSGFLIWLISSK